MDTQLGVIIVSGLTFLAVVGFVMGVYLLWQASWVEGHGKIRRRLRNLSAGGGHGREALELLRARQFSSDPVLNRLLGHLPRMESLDRLLQQSGSNATMMQFMGSQLVVALVLFPVLLFLLGMPWLLALLLALAGGLLLPVLNLQRRRRRRQAKIVELLPDSMDFIARALRAGNPFAAALKAAAKEMPEPIAEEFGITFDEINYGLEVEDALHNLETRLGGTDVAYFVTAVLIQRRTGGNLANVLNRIAAMLRERRRTVNEVRIQAAEMRLSAHILIALPFLVAGVLSLFRWEYMATLFEHPMGQVIVVIQLILMLFGYLVMRRMVNFRI